MKRIRAICLAGFVMVCNICLLSFPASAKDAGSPLNKVDWLAAPSHAPITLVKDGKAAAAIVLNADAEDKSVLSRSIRPAADIIQRYVKQLTGAELPIISASKARAEKDIALIVVGSNSISQEAGAATDKLPEDGFIVKTFPQGVVIAGDDGVTGCATLWGAYDFIERYLGFRFYYPGIGTYAPKKQSDLVLKPFAYTDHPRFLMRYDWNMAYGLTRDKWAWDNYTYGTELREMFDRYRVTVPGHQIYPLTGHTCNDWAKKYGKTRPEIFFKDKYGVRHIGENYPALESAYDVSHPLTLQTYMEELAQGLHKDKSNTVRFGLQDFSFEMTESPLYNKPEVAGRDGTMSDVLVDFYTRLSLAVKKEYPGTRVSGMFYLNYAAPPRTLTNRMPDNFYATVCLGISPAATKDQSRVDKAAGYLTGWNKILAHKPVVWDYSPGNYCYPVFVPVADMQKYYKEVWSQSNGGFHDLVGDWDMHHFANYTMKRMDWNPDFDIDAALDEYARLMYGDAAQPVKELYALLRERWASQPVYTAKMEDIYKGMYPPAVVEKVRLLLDQAGSRVPEGSMERTRLEFFAHGFDKFFADAKAIHSTQRVQMPAGQRMAEIDLDGNPSDNGWRHSDKINMRKAESGMEPSAPTTCQAAYDTDALYLLFVMKDNNPDKLVTNIKTRNGAVYMDDSVEMLIMPESNKDCYYQLMANTAGTIFAQKYIKDGDRYKADKWAASGTANSARVTKDGWVLEVRIPWSDLGVSSPKSGDTWPVNFVRNKWTPPGKELQSVSPTFGNNHLVDSWGMLKFESRGY